MTLGHPRSTGDTRISAGALQSPESNFQNPFDAQGFVDRFLERFGNDAEARLGKPILQELAALSKEGDPELFWDGALRLAGRLERGERLDASAALFQEIAQATAAGFPQLSSRAERGLQAIAGEGQAGARFEFLLRRFARETRDPWMILGFGAGSLAYRTTRFAALSQLWSPGRGFFMGRAGAGLLASAAGLGVETPAFLFSSKLGRQLGGVPQDWSRDTLAHELAGVGLTLLCLKSMGGLSGRAASGLGPFAGAAAPQAGMLAGIGLARRIEEALGLRPRVDNATFVTDSLTTYLQFFVSARLADRAFGPRFHALQAAWNWRRPSPGEAGGRAFPGLSWATPAPAAAKNRTRPGSSIQELMQAPLQSGSYDDGGDGSSEGLRYGYGPDTIMGIWFPSQAKPSNAVPIFTSTIDQVPLLLRSAYRHRPDRQHPRTILLEPSLGALQQISPKAAMIPQLLNSLTKVTGEQFPDKTPFKIMQVAERRTFVAKVTDRRLSWSEENDPTWARINRHSGSHEFEAETPLEIYLYIESLTRQPQPSPQTDYQVRYRGRSPASYGTTLEKFIERSLKFYRIAGKSFSVEFEDGQPSQRFIASNEEWMIEESGIRALPKPPASTAPLELAPKSPGSSRPVFPKDLPSAGPKKVPAVSPFSVITSFQALKDVGGLLSDPSLPRRIELWLEAPTNALLESGVWQQAFKDLRPGSILVVHESQTRKSFTFQRREDQVWLRSSPWSRPLAWESGLRLSSRDVIDLLQQLQFIANTKTVTDPSLEVSILGDWEPYHGKMLISLLNQWGHIPFEKIEIQAARPRSDVWLRLRRNHVGKFIEVD